MARDSPAKNNSGKSILFLSADLVGSTSYKQRTDGWQKIFLSFYREFPQFVQKAESDLPANGCDVVGFRLWKAIGDELIFEVTVTHERAVSRAVRIWLEALRSYEQEVLVDVGLSLKGGAFIATFPGPDSESSIPREPSVEDSDESVVVLNDKALKPARRATSKYHFDYFGPSIDTGFRVIGSASHRYFTMTVEVAWALSVAAHAAKADPSIGIFHSVNDFTLHSQPVLKGVWNGREYPIFAIDRHTGDPLNEAIRKMNSQNYDPQQVLEVCSACAGFEDWTGKLYLPESAHGDFQNVPVDAMESLRQSEPVLDQGVAPMEQDADDGEDLPSSAPMGDLNPALTVSHSS